MPLTTNSFTYAGGAQTFTLSLGLDYAAESDISVFVVGEVDGNGDQVYRTFTFDSEFVIRVTENLDVNDVVTVERTVSQTVRKVDFNTGGDVTPANLQLQYEHLFSLQQELLDGRVGLLNPASDATAAAASAAAAAVSAAAAAADEALTDADATATAADATATAADAVSTDSDATDTAADLVATDQDTTDTAADLVLTNADVVLTGDDVVLTNADVVLTNADVVLTGLDEAATDADATATAADATATAADAVSTAADAVSTDSDKTAAASSASAAAADEALTDADATATAADAASTAADVTAAAASAAQLIGTSTTSLAIAIAEKVFTTQSGKFFAAGNFLLITSDADPTDYMFGQVTTYSGTTLTVEVSHIGGSGTLADWTIRVSGVDGSDGADGAGIFVFSDATDVPVGSDFLPFYDATESNAPNKVTVENFYKTIQAGLSGVTTLDVLDLFPHYDWDGGIARNITYGNFLGAISALSALSTIADSDEFLVISDSDGNPDKILMSALRTNAAGLRANTSGSFLGPDSLYIAAVEVTLTDETTIAVDMNTFINAKVTLTDNRALGNPSNEKVGQTGFIRVIQDAGGTNTLSFGSDYEFAGGSAPSIATGGDDESILHYLVLATDRVLISLTSDID